MQLKAISTRITHLELHHKHNVTVPLPCDFKLALMKACRMPVHFYRYLYALIGKKHHWANDHINNDINLEALITNRNTLIHVFYVDGCPAGFCEIDLGAMPEVLEIVYFGLIPDFQGLNLSPFFFQEILTLAWAYNPGFIKTQTNTLDNPRALQLYQRFGFTPVSISKGHVKPWNAILPEK